MKESCRSTYSRAHTLAQASALFDINARSYEPHTRHSASSISSPSSISACRALTVISYCCLVLFEFNTTSKIRSQHKRKQKEKSRLDLYACEDFGWCERVQWNNLFYVYNYNKSGCQLDSFFFQRKKNGEEDEEKLNAHAPPLNHPSEFDGEIMRNGSSWLRFTFSAVKEQPVHSLEHCGLRTSRWCHLYGRSFTSFAARISSWWVRFKYIQARHSCRHVHVR